MEFVTERVTIWRVKVPRMGLNMNLSIDAALCSMLTCQRQPQHTVSPEAYQLSKTAALFTVLRCSLTKSVLS